MTHFLLAITTYNRVDSLKKCISSWQDTKSNEVNWNIVIADDGSMDGTIDYIKNLNIENCNLTLIQNKRIGVHQQMNTILKTIKKIEFDFCFKIDDDITFLKPGWDMLYYKQAINTGYHHLVFCEKKWEQEQFLEKPIKKKELIAHTNLINAHGFFYTFTKEVINKIGYFDIENFGFRGMGHIDFTARACRAGYNDINNPFDIDLSNEYISAYSENYSGAINKTWIQVYDSYFRIQKETIIHDNKRVYIPFTEIDQSIYSAFTNNVFKALAHKVETIDAEKKELETWYLEEKTKIENWYKSQYSHLPKWYLKIGKIFKLKSK